MDKELRCRNCVFFDDSLTKDKYPLCLKKKRRGQSREKYQLSQSWKKICEEFINKEELTVK